MSRSSKKGPYVDKKLLMKVKKYREHGDKKPIKTWARRSAIHPDFVGMTFEVHNGKTFMQVFINESMVGHKLGEFALTRKFTGHSKKGKVAKATGSAGRVLTE